MRQIIERRTVLDCISFDLLGKGQLAVRFQLASFLADGSVFDDGSRTGPIQKNKYRFVLEPGDDIDALIVAVTPHLEALGYGAPSDADVRNLKSIATICWSPESVADATRRWVAWEASNARHCLEQGIRAMSLEQGRTIDFMQRVSLSLAELEAPNHRMLS